jgi:hypothetical protein
MVDPRRVCCPLLVLLALASLPGHALRAQEGSGEKPSLSLKATPPLGFSPLRVRTVVDVRGGADDYQDFYCAAVEWDWGDGTMSENASDCEPYQAGKSTIRRQFTADHVYRQRGSYRLVFRLKQKSKVVGLASAQIQVRGLGEGGGG